MGRSEGRNRAWFQRPDCSSAYHPGRAEALRHTSVQSLRLLTKFFPEGTLEPCGRPQNLGILSALIDQSFVGMVSTQRFRLVERDGVKCQVDYRKSKGSKSELLQVRWDFLIVPIRPVLRFQELHRMSAPLAVRMFRVTSTGPFPRVADILNLEFRAMWP